jgi:hypothetical protein
MNTGYPKAALRAVTTISYEDDVEMRVQGIASSGQQDARQVAGPLDVVRFDELARLAELASSSWRSVGLAADRGDVLTVITHCKQPLRSRARCSLWLKRSAEGVADDRS